MPYRVNDFRVRPIGWRSDPAQTTPLARVLLIGGGGGGGSGAAARMGAGGGAGGFLETFIPLSPKFYNVVVGKGGLGGWDEGSTQGQFGCPGQPSYIDGILFCPGGLGGDSERRVPYAGGFTGRNDASPFFRKGASGGGTFGDDKMLGIPPFGNNGGASIGHSYPGGGGGAGGPGESQTSYADPPIPANGGPGKASDISGTLTYYCGGGGSAGDTRGGFGGSGVGGDGAHEYNVPATSGAPNSGSGGGGGWHANGYTQAANGSDGICIIRYKTGTISAYGGTITYDGDDTIHTFTSSGTLVIGNDMRTIEALVVAGGGGGGTYANSRSAGGGGGGIVYEPALLLSSGSYAVTVGLGGLPCSDPTIGNGGDSYFAYIHAIGGGGGAYWDGAGHAGGSAGGSFYYQIATENAVNGQGHRGGTGSRTNPYGAGGGGGAGADGGDGTASRGGDGGNGLEFSISGTPTYYSGGGSGDVIGWGDPSASNPGTPGLGGGGTGKAWAPGGTAGAPNTGGGGGGGASGGSGIVIIRYPTGSINASGGTVTTFGEYTIHTFLSSGTFTLT